MTQRIVDVTAARKSFLVTRKDLELVSSFGSTASQASSHLPAIQKLAGRDAVALSHSQRRLG
jgi:hypothetical protein